MIGQNPPILTIIMLLCYVCTGLSHCRHMTKVRQSVLPQLVTSTIVHAGNVVSDVIGGCGSLTQAEWDAFTQLPSTEVSLCVCIRV